MTNRYSFETQKILNDFLINLENNADINSDVLAELQLMVQEGTLGKPVAISKVVQILEDQQHDLQN